MGFNRAKSISAGFGELVSAWESGVSEFRVLDSTHEPVGCRLRPGGWGNSFKFIVSFAADWIRFKAAGDTPADSASKKS
jgi:hypothetical protein